MTEPTRFLTDASLARLARRLCFLGYDVELRPGARLEDLLAVAARDERTVLTTSHRHPRRWREVRVVVVDRTDEAGALRAITAAHAPASPEFGRCSRCNTALQTRTPFEAHGEVPGRVVRTAKRLFRCPTCAQWYWEGSHVARLRESLAAAIGRPVPGPAGPSSEPESGG